MSSLVISSGGDWNFSIEHSTESHAFKDDEDAVEEGVLIF